MLEPKMNKTIAIASLMLSTAVFAPLQMTSAQTLPGHDHHHLMVGVDGRSKISFGTFAGLDNPNYNRLTLLFPHLESNPADNHFHGIGAYSYTGDVSNPTVIPTSTNNQIPEYWTNLPPISLIPGTGTFAGKLVNEIIEGNTEHNYTNLKIAPVGHLVDELDDPAIAYLFNSSNGAWQGSLGNATIAIELVKITPGLGVATASGQDLFTQVGDLFAIGSGDDFNFTPTFYATARGQHSATFRLVDVNTSNGYTPLPTSGTFMFNFQSTLEPSTYLSLITLGLMGFLSRFRTDT